ncbi:DMT family transporter [Thermodesulfobacteriota bacterium]
MAEDPPNNQELPFLAAVYTSILCIFFGGNAVAIKISLSGLGPFTTVGFRSLLSALAILLWAKISGRLLAIKKGQMHQLLILTIAFVVQFSLLYPALDRTNASRGTLLMNLMPFFVLFLAHFFIPGDRITKRKLLGLSMGFAGMALVFLWKKGVTTSVQIGDFMILIAAFLWACSTIYTKRIINAFDPFHLVLYPVMFSIPFFFLAGFLWDSKMVMHVNVKVLVALLYQSLLAASFGFVAWTNLLQKYGAVSLNSFIFIMPIAGVSLGGLVLGEPITINILLALLLIVSGIIVVNLKTRKYAPLFPTRGI